MVEERNYKVYVHENKINGKKYIGITRRQVERRWGHQGNCYVRSPYFWRAIQKYGWDTFSHEVWFQNLTGKEANELEKVLIKSFKTSIKKYGYNLQQGGSDVNPKSKETSKKLSLINKGRKPSKETRKKISEHHADVSGKNNPMYGRHLENGQPVRCLDSNKVYKDVQTAARELNLRADNIWQVLCNRQKSTGGYHFIYEKNYIEGKWYNTEVGNDKHVLCLNTGEVFNSLKECAEKFGVDPSAVTKVCKGKQRHTGGYNFQYWRGQKIEEIG